MRVLAIKNAKNEGLEYIENIFEARNIEFDYVMAKEIEEVSEYLDYTHFIILGGPQGVYEDDKHPYLKKEMELIRLVDGKKPVLGVCLGAQLIANAFGADVYKYKKELGWYSVRKVADLPFPDEMVVFQWHQDTFNIPEDAKIVFKGDNVENQGFILRKNVAVQFHLEVTKDTVRNWLESEGSLDDEVKDRIVEDTDKYIDDLNRNTEILIEWFLNL
ncbi:GMP synthase - Glutamine amidotransferase domain protein [Archaeoglobus sulfaticallidus PM70-1]|uniref:GMP synthase-Glutamine amidotransferase domain protein n=1 Tax=Archaeoglobus sulfaticallidus PM70-1 TaxID=387631 RepID=N0BI84_9EURY|nr:type 1 glutamine amidotransferase [Archaeoglobus sulfaticallidus]AGK60166.1 GMP synthase - Glutamine amidotransferase domain protein [Archaeoglobus sulfaticallidus PM70-1]